MISKNDIKNIKSLAIKKIRKEKGVFIAEGHKMVEEVLNAMESTLIVLHRNGQKSRKDYHLLEQK